MAKKSPVVEKIAGELNREFENYKSRVLPKFHRKARGKLRKLQRSLSKLKPLKVKNHLALEAERSLKMNWAKIGGQIANAKRKAASNRGTVARLSKEVRMLKREIPHLNRSASSWSRAQRSIGRRHNKVSRDLRNLNRWIAKEEKKKGKALKQLQKYFG